MFSSALGALIGSAIDGADGDDGTADGAIIGAATAFVVRATVPIVVTYLTGWLVLKGIDMLKDRAFGNSGDTA